MSNASDQYRSMSAREVVEHLSIKVFEPPLSHLLDDLRSVPEVLRIPILLIVFDTEVTMEGMLGFVENSTGRYLVDTIDALETIAAHQTAETLRSIQRIMSDHGVTVEHLRRNLNNAQLYQITNFRELHGEELVPMAEQIDREAQKLYLYRANNSDSEPVFDLLEAYLQERRNELVAALESVSRLQFGT
jgi:Domain of unknown function (DUF4375)